MRTRQQARNARAVPTRKVLRYCHSPPLPSHHQERASEAGNLQKKLRRRAVSTYAVVFSACLFLHSGLIRLYGDTCGLSLHNIHRLLTVGSPWCHGLNWACWATGQVVERGWYHAVGLGVCTVLEALSSESHAQETEACARDKSARSMMRGPTFF